MLHATQISTDGMAEYYLNNKPLSDFGIVPSRSNKHIALSGCFDLPKRIGDTYFDWPRENGVDPYVDESDIQFDSRSIRFTGYIIGNLELNVRSLQNYVLALPELSMLSCKWGSWNVKVNKSIDITPIDKNNARISISFVEPIPDLSGTLPPISTIKDIDDYSWKSLGLYIEKINGSFNIKPLKSLDVTQNPDRTIRTTGGEDKGKVTISAHVVATSFEDFKSRIKSLYRLFGSAGLRTINYRGRSIYCFAINGFTITNVIMKDIIVAKFACELIETSKIIHANEDI